MNKTILYLIPIGTVLDSNSVNIDVSRKIELNKQIKITGGSFCDNTITVVGYLVENPLSVHNKDISYEVEIKNNNNYTYAFISANDIDTNGKDIKKPFPLYHYPTGASCEYSTSTFIKNPHGINADSTGMCLKTVYNQGRINDIEYFQITHDKTMDGYINDMQIHYSVVPFCNSSDYLLDVLHNDIKLL